MSAVHRLLRTALAKPVPAARPVRGFGPGVLVLGVVLFASALIEYVRHVQAHQPELWKPVDLQVYYWGGTTARHTHHVYDLAFVIGPTKLPFTYTPFALEVFKVLSYVDELTLQWWIGCAGIAGLVVCAWVAWGLAGYRRNWGRLGAALAVGGLALWTEPMMQNLKFGQVNVFLMLLVLLDFAQRDRWWTKGVGIGLAAGFKLVPGIFILYLLVTRRLRAAAVATATLAATVLGGFLITPREAHRYWIDGLFNDSTRVGHVEYVGNQSIQGLLARTLHLDTQAVKPYWLAAALLVVLVTVPLMFWAYRRGEELLGVAVTALLGLLVSPISWSHHWVWTTVFLVAGGCLLHSRRAPWWGWVLATVPYLLCFAWPTVDFRDRLNGTVLPNGLIWSPPDDNHVEFHWHGLQHLSGNIYPLLGLGALAGLWLFLWRSRPQTSTTLEAT